MSCTTRTRLCEASATAMWNSAPRRVDSTASSIASSASAISWRSFGVAAHPAGFIRVRGEVFLLLGFVLRQVIQLARRSSAARGQAVAVVHA